MGEIISPKKLFLDNLFSYQHADYPAFICSSAGKKTRFRQFCHQPKAQFPNKGKGMAIRLPRQPVQSGKHIAAPFVPAKQKTFHHIAPNRFLLAKRLTQKAKMYHGAFA